ncbi:MAG: M55 family metallopeptidase [Verrucomicrobia bacterium]|nr:M55 family metallopeptidase [Verrucomicrobiota bacterium]
MMKVYIWCDMEGVAGVSIWNQVMPEHPLYQESRRLMTEEINAAAQGAFDAGATYVLVDDGHWFGHNLMPSMLDPRVECVMGYDRDFLMELDGSFDLLLGIGAHAKAGAVGANLGHTMDPDRWVELKVNGHSVGEIGLVGAVAGEHGVPFALITGDDKACAEAAALIPGVVQACVKKGIAAQCARSLAPTAARDCIRARAREACLAARSIAPLRLGGSPATVEVVMLAESGTPFKASSLDASTLALQKTVTTRATGQSVRQALREVLHAKSETT